jgi:hypothetical protein
VSDKPVKTVTTVQQVDANGDVVSETITTVETTKQPEPPRTGMYL